MTTVTKDAPSANGTRNTAGPSPWELLRQPFPPEHIGLKPQPLKRGSEKGKCDVCHGWHGLPAIHLDVINHAEVTDRLLSVDPAYELRPLALDADGLPLLDRDASGQPVGMWFTLTVNGVTKMEYGTCEDGSIKNLLSDCIKRGGMRFGVALDIWRKLEKSQAGDEVAGEPGRAVARGASRPQCSICASMGITSQLWPAKGGPKKGQLQCNGKTADGKYLNHFPPTEAQPETDNPDDQTPIPFDGPPPPVLTKEQDAVVEALRKVITQDLTDEDRRQLLKDFAYNGSSLTAWLAAMPVEEQGRLRDRAVELAAGVPA